MIFIKPKKIIMERREKIMKIVRDDQNVRIRALADTFNVTTETIRKDLIYLEQQGFLRKNYGGAVLEVQPSERSIEPRMREHIQQKAVIAQRMMNYLPERGVLILDAGSTVYQLAALLATSEHTYTIVTNSIVITNLLSGSHHSLLCVGGEMRSSTMSMTGFWSINALNSIKADIAILGTSGFCSHGGPCAEAFVEADVKKAILKNSRRHFVLADSSKFDTDALVCYAPWTQIDMLITDNGALKDYIDALKDQTQVDVVTI